MLTIRPREIHSQHHSPAPVWPEESWLHFPKPELNLRIPRTHRSPPSEACHFPGLHENKTPGYAFGPREANWATLPKYPFPIDPLQVPPPVGPSEPQ